MNAKRGIREFGELAVAAMFKEFKQLDSGVVPGKPVIAPVDVDKLSPTIRRTALEAVNLIKEKRDGKIKGRTCANGSRQRRYLNEDESISSPTVSLEGLLATLVIDAFEERDVAIFDVPGAYLHAKMPKDKQILMKIRDQFVDIMCEVNPEYKQYVRIENGKKVLYVQVLQALYGCIESALLWYELFSSTLEKEGFIINPYDRCVANKTINGEQCTIAWYVDDNKLSHKDPKVVTDVLEIIKSHFGDLTISRGKKHTFLGMNITLRKDKKIQIEMKDQLKETIAAFKEDITTSCVTPAALHLFDVNDKSPKLDEARSENFHHVVAKLLYLTKRARPDIETAVAFLCTRVTKCDEDDWKKLRRVLQYINGTLDISES